MDMGCCYSVSRVMRETLSNNNPCPSSPSSTIYIYIYIQSNLYITTTHVPTKSGRYRQVAFIWRSLNIQRYPDIFYYKIALLFYPCDYLVNYNTPKKRKTTQKGGERGRGRGGGLNTAVNENIH